ncbi:FMN-dependent NADH-azoreductase [Bacillus sp. JCM 19045]|uniref:FMN dependent NADH:quinone oxidoreductase n=1 Tax=Shouchella xiaoxiensis TaxID=766895 RepID=A0ABS2SVH4_9BACI|nr:FMN-dependent NADH-azoreductase [Shouchella xiaoxiensis]MBM7839539.1 FMN-dependent NADH-azoreductase [Shouchella xiaoxiensis]GAF15417.1 FMN-dependent NADH-azoreductase [Bacillus sp. JCM 19045]
MAKVLMINASDRFEQGVSVKMHKQFLTTYQSAHPEDTIEEVHLFAENLPYYGDQAITGQYKKAQGMALTNEEEALVAKIESYQDQFMNADKVVFSFPLWNYTVPAPMITYLSYLAQAGKTFRYTATGPIGLVGDKEVALLSARGGLYSEGTPMENAEMAMKLVRQTISLWGIISPIELFIEGHNAAPDQKDQIIGAGLEQVEQAAQQF